MLDLRFEVFLSDIIPVQATDDLWQRPMLQDECTGGIAFHTETRVCFATQEMTKQAYATCNVKLRMSAHTIPGYP